RSSDPGAPARWPGAPRPAFPCLASRRSDTGARRWYGELRPALNATMPFPLIPRSSFRCSHENLVHQKDSTERPARPGREERTADRAADRLATTVTTLERQLDPFSLAGEHGADGLTQLLHREPDVEVHEMAPLHLAGPKPPQVFRAVVPREHLNLRVHDGHGDLEARQDRREERVRGVELVAPHP